MKHRKPWRLLQEFGTVHQHLLEASPDVLVLLDEVAVTVIIVPVVVVLFLACEKTILTKLKKSERI